MKSKNWLGISALLNVISFGLLIVLAVRQSNAPPMAPGPNVASAVPDQREEQATVATPAVTKHTAGVHRQEWIQALRTAGVSERLIADFVAADFHSRWQQCQREILKQFNRGEVEEDALARFGKQHGVELESELRAALGEEGFRVWDQDRLLRDFDLASMKLSESETDALCQLRKGFEQQRRELQEAAQRGEIDEADIEKQLEARQAQYDKELKTLLGDERYAAAQDSSEPGIGDLIRGLRKVNASEAQMGAMLQAQSQWNDQCAKLERQLQDDQITSQEYEQQMKALGAARDQGYLRVLGADGFAEFQKVQDDHYKTMKRYAGAWGLSDSDINSLYNTIQYYENSVRDYRQRAQSIEEQGQPVDWPAVQRTLQEFSRQTEEALQRYLGDERYDKLKRSGVFSLKN